jgi:hypothetical protein
VVSSIMIGELPHFADLWPASPLAKKTFPQSILRSYILLDRLLMLKSAVDSNILAMAAEAFINQIISGLMAQWQGA